MGSVLSPILAEIYLGLIEEQFIQPLIDQKIIFSWRRYVDDTFVSLPRRNVEKVFEYINNIDKNLRFTRDDQVNGVLRFLDTEVYRSKVTKKYETRLYRKDIKSDFLNNFQTSITPKSYLISTLVGEIHRANNVSTTESDLENALDKLKIRFQKHGYSSKLIESKIKEVKERDFQKKPSSKNYEEEKKYFPNRNISLSLTFTSKRCSKIAQAIRNELKEITPEYSVNFCWRTVNTDSLILPRLKRKIDDFHQTNTVYQFSCVEPCKSSYIGETSRRVFHRIYEHNRLSSSNVFSHISTCEHYQRALHEKHPTATFSDKRNFIKECFHIKCVNISNYFERIIAESVLIKFNKPDLNDQVQSKALSII